MPRPTRQAEIWYEKAAEIMIREEKTLRQAAMDLSLDITSEDCANIERRKSFQMALWAARNRLYKELATDPERNKNTLEGQLLFLAQKLIETKQYDKAAEVLFKLAKVEGHVGADTTISVIGQLTPEDIATEKKKIEGLLKVKPSPGGASEILPN